MLKPVVTLCLAALALSACEPSAECADPTLLTTTGTLPGEDVLVHLWEPDGQRDRLTTGPVALGRDGGAELSPDGDLAAFQQPVGEHDIEHGWPGTAVAVLSLETGEVTLLTDAVEGVFVRSLQWSGDGSQIAFERFTRTREIAVVGVDGKDERTLLTLSRRQEGGFAWSSDGQELLVPTLPSSVVSGEVPGPGEDAPASELWRYSVETGEHEVVPTPHRFIWDVSAWSPDERLVAMSATTTEPEESGTERLYVFDLESGTTTAVDRRRGGPTGLTWSGPYLLYVYSVRAPGDDYDHQLMRWDSRTRKREQVHRPGLGDERGTYTDISAPRCP